MIEIHTMTADAVLLAQALIKAPNCCRTLHPRDKLSLRSQQAIDELEAAGWVHVGNELLGPLAMATGKQCATLTRKGLESLMELDCD